MKIVVCIKQVPDTAEVKTDPRTHTLVRDGARSMLNPFDAFAIEEALRQREQHGGLVTAISMGPPQAEAVLREALAMGVDAAVLLGDRALAGSDTWATSYALAAAIRKLGGADLLFFGRQAADGDTAQVGPGVAAHLNLPQITCARRIVSVMEKQLRAERLLDHGVEVVVSSLPCVLTVVREINEPRLPSLAGVLRARTVDIQYWNADDIGVASERIGLEGSPTRVTRIFAPAAPFGGEMLRGAPAETVAKLAEKLGIFVKTHGP